MADSVAAVVVSYADPLATREAVRSLLDQSRPPAETIVVDNDPNGAIVREPPAQELQGVRVVRPGVNLGYTRAANLAAEQAGADWLFFLNPDAVAAKDCLERLLEAVDGEDVAIVGAQVLLPDGRVNAGDNPVNIAGVSWSGRYGEVREHGPARDVAAVSGAALLVRRHVFLQLGGLCPHFFMYYDDADLAWRARMSGLRVRYCPRAAVVHEYEFDKGSHKWFHLERNREWALLSNLRPRTLALLAPLLLATELVVVARAISEGWLAEKARAWGSLATQLPSLIEWRRQVQSKRNVSDFTVLSMFSASVRTQLIDVPRQRWIDACLARYRRFVLALLAPVLAALCLALAACGGSDPRGTAASTTDTTAATVARIAGEGRHDGDGDVDLGRQIRWDGDNDAVPTFGPPAGVAERGAIVAAIRRYYAAADRADGAAACALLDPVSVEALLERHGFGSLPPSRQAGGCARIVSALLARDRAKLRQETSSYSVPIVQVRGRKAYVFVRFSSRRELREQQLWLRRVEGGWRMQQPLDGAAV